MGFPAVSEMMGLSETGKRNNSVTMGDIKQYFGVSEFDGTKIDEIGLHLQVFRKRDLNNVSYLHGHIIHFALEKYITQNNDINTFNLFETGTARGFSSVIMAYTLDKNNMNGIINTFDIKHYDHKTEKECLCAALKQRSVSTIDCIEPFSDLVEKYIKFNVGDTNKILKTRESDRIHFAFLDGDHRYSSLLLELNYVEKHQQSGDVIIVDDYSIPELKKATDEFLTNESYDFHVLNGKVGGKTRKYVHLVKK
jgi:predicted O-methyltransferase YrrM